MTDAPLPNCTTCGAEHVPHNKRCWLCGAAREPAGPAVTRKPRTRPSHAASTSAGTAIAVPLGIVLLLGAFLTAPGFGLTLAFFMLPVVAGIASATRRVEARGGQVSTSTFLLALVGGGLVLAAIFIGAFAAIYIICTGAYGTNAMDSLFVLAIGIGFCGLIGGMVFGTRFARRYVLTHGTPPRDEE